MVSGGIRCGCVGEMDFALPLISRSDSDESEIYGDVKAVE